MVQASNGDWLRRSQPMRHVRREARWALQENNDGSGDKHAPTTRLPVLGGVRADVSLLRVGASPHAPTLSCRLTGNRPLGEGQVDALILHSHASCIIMAEPFWLYRMSIDLSIFFCLMTAAAGCEPCACLLHRMGAGRWTKPTRGVLSRTVRRRGVSLRGFPGRRHRGGAGRHGSPDRVQSPGRDPRRGRAAGRDAGHRRRGAGAGAGGRRGAAGRRSQPRPRKRGPSARAWRVMVPAAAVAVCSQHAGNMLRSRSQMQPLQPSIEPCVLTNMCQSRESTLEADV